MLQIILYFTCNHGIILSTWLPVILRLGLCSWRFRTSVWRDLSWTLSQPHIISWTRRHHTSFSYGRSASTRLPLTPVHDGDIDRRRRSAGLQGAVFRAADCRLQFRWRSAGAQLRRRRRSGISATAGRGDLVTRIAVDLLTGRLSMFVTGPRRQ